jgi:hypothetical protein
MIKLLPKCALLACVSFLLSACHKKDPASELEKAAVTLATTEPAPAAPVAGATSVPTGPPPAEQMREAISEYKAGKMEDAVTRLQLLRSTPTLSAEQRMAVQDGVAAVMAEIYSLAEKGDPRAIAAVAQYEKMQTRR